MDKLYYVADFSVVDNDHEYYEFYLFIGEDEKTIREAAEKMSYDVDDEGEDDDYETKAGFPDGTTSCVLNQITPITHKQYEFCARVLTFRQYNLCPKNTTTLV